MAKGLQSMDRNRLALGGIALAAVFFVALNVLSNALFTGVRLDLTEDSRFTVSPGTEEVLRGIGEPVALRLYISKQIEDLGPFYAGHAARVGELLDTYAELSSGKVRVERYDPQPFSPEEDLAVADGLQGIPLGNAGTQVFFGLAGRNSTDDTQSIPYLAPERANFLEYDLTQLVFDLANPDKPVVALIGDLPLQGSQLTQFQPWAVMDPIRQAFDLRSVYGEVDRIDEDVEILLLAQPTQLSERTLYAIDQFVLGGGRVLAFVDPLAESMAPAQPGAPPPGSAVEALAPLLEAWGVEIAGDKVVGDFLAAIQVRANHNGRQVVTHFLPWIDVGADQLDPEDVVTGSLQQINLRSAGAIRVAEASPVTLEPLIVSSEEALEIDASRLRGIPDPVGILNESMPTGEVYTLAARVAGPVESAFPDGPPEAVEDEAVRGAHRTRSDGPANLILVADADLLADRNWIQSGSLLGQGYSLPIANNGDFVVNALDNLRGSEALIALRGRGFAQRPFEVIEAMTVEAETRYRAAEQNLLAEIAETQTKIRALQQEEQESGLLPGSEQQETIEAFRTEMIAQRRQLRDVQLALREDVEALATRVRFLNIWAMPILIGLIALGLALLRHRRAARFQATAGA